MLALQLKSRGMEIKLHDDALIVRTRNPLTDDLRSYLRQHKKQLISELKMLARPQRKCCMWFYKLHPDNPGYTQMGLMTDDIQEARRQLSEIYGREITGLHRRG